MRKLVSLGMIVLTMGSLPAPAQEQEKAARAKLTGVWTGYAVVGKGEVIGYVGTTDPALGPHLHFELRPEGHAVDPLDYLTPKP